MRYAMLAVLGSAAILVAGCPSEPAPPEPSGTAVAESAYQQLKDANKVFDCSTAYDVINSVGGGKTEFDVAPIRKAAREYSDLNSTYRDRLSAIAFPPAAQPIAEEVRRLVTTQIQDLRWLTGIYASEQLPVHQSRLLRRGCSHRGTRPIGGFARPLPSTTGDRC